MTPSEIELAAREQYNAIGDTTWSSAEIMRLIYGACLELANETNIIERTYTTDTVAAQQEYDFPTNTISIKRITYEGNKLQPITFRDDDTVTVGDADTTAQGTPQYYMVWNRTIYLRSVPDAVGELKIFSYNRPQAVTSSSTLEIPDEFHMDVVDYVLEKMNAKDRNFEGANYHRGLWMAAKQRAKQWVKKRKRADGFAAVQDEESHVGTILGTV